MAPLGFPIVIKSLPAHIAQVFVEKFPEYLREGVLKSLAELPSLSCKEAQDALRGFQKATEEAARAGKVRPYLVFPQPRPTQEAIHALAQLRNDEASLILNTISIDSLIYIAHILKGVDSVTSHRWKGFIRDEIIEIINDYYKITPELCDEDIYESLRVMIALTKKLSEEGKIRPIKV